MKKQLMDQAGEIKGAGGGGKTPKASAPVEAPNTLQAFIRGRILDLIAYGPIKGLVNGLKSVYLDSTPVQNADGTFNFEGVELEFRNGTPDQDVIPGFTDVENTTEINTEVLYDNPPVRTLTNNDADSVAITVQLAGLAKQEDNGNIVPYSVAVMVDISDNGGAWSPAFSTVINGKTTSAYPQTYRIKLPDTDGPFSVRVRRGNKESDSDKIRDALTWTLMTEIIEQPFSYPNMALAGITVNSKLFGSSLPARSYDVYLSVVKVPSNYNPETRAYTGLWDGTFKEAWTDNPAWAYYDLATHPIIGAGLLNVDKWELYRIGQYCDELVPDGYGGMEPRFTINTVFSEQEDAYVALNTLASVFRGMTYWGTNTVVPVGDMPTEPSRTVGPGNVVDGEFSYVGTADRERHSVCIAMWNDPENEGKSTPEPYEDPESIVKYGWRETRVTAVACTSRGQAHRLAKWILYSERMETQTLTYKAKLDHATLRPGEVIEVGDPDYQGARMVGRLKEGHQNVLHLDQVDHNAITTIGGTWYVSVVMPDQRVEKAEVSSFDGNTVYLVGALPEAPQAGAIWALSSAGLVLPQYRVVSVKEEDDSTYVITATEYDPNKYAYVEYDLKLPERPTSLIPTGPITPPTDMTFEVYKYQAGGTEHQGVVVSWKPSKDVRVDSYVLDVQGPTDLAYRTVYTGQGISFDLQDAHGGQWLFRVRAVAKGIPSQWLMRTVQLQMLLLPTPPDSVDIKLGTLELTLTPVSAYPDALWEFWRSTVALGEGQIETNASYIATGSYLVDTGLKPDTQYFYYIRGTNQYGKSSWYAVQAKTENNFDDILDAVTEDIKNGPLYEVINEQIDTKATQVAIDKATEVVNEAMVDVNSQLTTIGETVSQLNAEVTDVRADLTAGLADANTSIGNLTTQANQLRTDLDASVASINGQLTSIGTDLTGIHNTITTINGTTASLRTDLTSLQGTVSTEVTRINGTLTSLQSQITNAVDANQYNKALAYTAGQFAYIGNSLYQAKIAVPAKADGTNAPPNATYWRDAGTVIASADGLAARVSSNETSIGTINGTLTSQATTISGIQTTLNGKADASALTALTNRVTAAEGTITSQGTAITNLTNTVNGKADASALTALTTRVTTAEGTISSQGTAITNLTNTVAGKADASALTALTTRVTANETAISSQASSLTSIQSVLGQQPDNLILKGTFEDGTIGPWTASPVITNVSAHPSYSKGLAFYANSFCGTTANVITSGGEMFDCTADVWNNYMTAGQTARLQMQFFDKASASLGYFTAFTVNAGTNGFQSFSGRITAPTGAVTARFVVRNEPSDGTGRSLWVNMVARRVSAAETANASAVSSLTTRVTAAEGTITSQGTAITNLTNTVNGKADASALTALTTRVTTAEGTIASQGTAITNLTNSLAGKADASALNALTTRVTAAEGTITSQGTAITNLTNTVNGKADASALTALTTRVTTAEGTIASQGTAITNLTNTVNGKADASALTALTTRVTTAEGTISSQGSAITNLTNTVSGKADSSTVTALSNTVTQQGNTIAAQGTAVTNIQATLGNIAGSGVNLLPSEYSWLASATLPNVNSSLLTRSAVAVADAPSGYGYYLQPTSNSLFSYLVLAPFNSPAYYNLPLEAGTYLVSFYAKGDTAGQVMANLYDGTTSRSVTLAYTTDRQRLTFAITLPAAAKSVLLIYPNRQGATPPVGLTVDSIMVEKRVGETNTPSPFVAGGAGSQLAGMASATSALEARVTAAEGVNTSQSTSITNLTNSLGGKADASALTALTTRVTTAEGTISSQGTAITNLTNSLAGKADASALTALTTRVTTAEGTIASQGTAITNLTNSLAGKADASALNSLTTRVTAAEGLITSQGNAITGLTSVIGQQPDNLVLKGTFEDSDVGPWTNSPSISNVSAHPSYSKAITFYDSSFCGTTRNIVTRGGEEFDCSADVWNNYMTAGQTCRLQIQFYDKAVTNLGYFTAFTVNAGTNGFQTYSGRITAPAGAVTARFVIRHETADGSGRSLWCNIVARRVTAADSANAAATTALTTRVTAAEGTITSQGTAITNLTNTVNGKADASALNALTTRVTAAEGTISSQGTAITNLTNTVNGKADASALTALTTRVTTAEGTIASQGTAITNLTNSVAGKADASALNALTTRVTTAEGTISSQGSSLLALTSMIGQQPDNLILKGTFEDGGIGPWTADPTIVNVTAHPSYSKAIQFMANSFCGTTRNLITRGGEEFDCSADIYNNNMSAGQNARLQIQFYDKNVVNLGYFTAFTCPAGANGFQTYSGRITAPAGAVTARFLIRHETADGTGRSLWCNIVARRVTAADSANAAATTALTTRVTTAEGTLTSQGTAITNLTNTVNGKADASAVTALTTRVTTAEGLITSQGNSITNLTNSLAGKADVSAVNSLTTRMTAAEGAISSQGTATTALQTTIANQGGNGSNLVPDTYSWITGSPLPATPISAGNTVTAVAVTGSASGFGYKFTSGSTNTGVFFMLSPTNNAAGYNVPLEVGTYLVSFYASAPTAATIRASLFDGTGRVTPNFALTTTRTRYAGIVTVTAATRAAVTLYPNLAGVSGTEVTIDSVMVEKMNNGATVATPSPFVAGPSAQTAAVQAAAINTLDVRVTAAEGVNTSQATSITSLTSRMGTAETSITNTASTLASTNGALTSLWAMKINTTSNGKQYVAGMGVSMITSGGITQSEILFQADRFALVNTANNAVTVPFVIENGVTYISQAMIKAATITNLLIGQTLTSTAQTTWGGPVMAVDFNQGLQIIRHPTMANTYTLNNNGGTQVIVSGVLRVRMGVW